MSPTLDIVNDYFRFVIGFFEVISISAPHIYHSALPLSPRESIVYKIHKPYIRLLPRVVCGLPISWEPTVATVRHTSAIEQAAWSLCSRFIAVALQETIEILDAATLERLHTFESPGYFLPQWLSFSPDSRSLTWFGQEHGLTTWDLQTGGRISAIPSTSNMTLWYFSSAYSTDGKIIAVAYKDLFGTIISTYGHLSGTHIYSHRVSEGQIVAPIWTHGGFLRFVTVKPGSITIWEIGFTSEHTFAEVESLPAPDDDVDPRRCMFLPTRTRLAYIFDEKAVLVWDARDSKIILNFPVDEWPTQFSFSSDGRFFTCRTDGGEIHLWKESPTGYVLHRKLASHIDGGLFAEPLLSPNGESIIIRGHSLTQLLRTTDLVTSLPIVPTQPSRSTEFILEFSPDRSLAVAARLWDKTAMIIDLKSGDPRLIIDTDAKICGLGVTANTVIVVDEEKVITWNLSAGDCVPDAKANIHDSVRTIVLNHPAPPSGWLSRASISPNFNYVVITQGPNYESLDVYDVFTGKHLVGTATVHGYTSWFTRDGCEVWSSVNYITKGWKIIKGEKSDVIGLEPLGSNANPSGGYLWQSSRGHDVTDDGWILDSRKKRVMWLPHRWRIHEENRIWEGRFLGLLDLKLQEPVIIELDE